MLKSLRPLLVIVIPCLLGCPKDSTQADPPKSGPPSDKQPVQPARVAPTPVPEMSPAELGAERSRLSREAIATLATLLDAELPATELQAKLSALAGRYKARFIDCGRAREALSPPQRKVCDDADNHLADGAALTTIGKKRAAFGPEIDGLVSLVMSARNYGSFDTLRRLPVYARELEELGISSSP